MAIKLLGIDVSDKSNDELRHIIETLGLNNISDKSTKKLEKFPEEMRKSWIDNPDSTGELSDETIAILSKNMVNTNEKISRFKIYSPEYSASIHKLDDNVHRRVSESSLDDKMNMHYNQLYYALKKSPLHLNSKEMEYICEAFTSGTGDYDKHREEFISSGIAKSGGMFDVRYSVMSDIGSRLQKRTSDIECIIGDKLGIDETDAHGIAIIPDFDNSKFTVSYSSSLSDADKIIKDTISDEIKDMGFSCDNFSIGESFPLKDGKFEQMKSAVHDDGYKLSDVSENELKHAKTVITNGFNSYGYNDDDFDANGHSRDGEYNPNYDTAYQSPDF